GMLSQRIKNEWIKKQWVKNERIYNSARAIKEKYVDDSVADEIVNTFQWAKANVQLRSPASAPEIYRLEADQKFFRGLIVVLIIICLLFIFKYKTGWGALVPYLVVL